MAFTPIIYNTRRADTSLSNPKSTGWFMTFTA